jgi:exosome complex component RRP42
MSEDFKRYIIALAEKGLRADGRKLLEHRKPVKIEYDISKKAEGSCKVTLGKTVVNCGVKMGIGEPYPDKPDEGSLIVNAEFAPISSPEFEPGAPGEESIEVSRVVDRGIREAGAIDTKKLCVKSGEKVWMAFIDLYIENHDGNLIDACGLGAIAALSHAVFPKYDEATDRVMYDEHTTTKVPIVHTPLPCTIIKIGKHFLVDPTAEEEAEAEARLTVSTDEHGIINAMQKGGSVGMSEEEIEECVKIALEKNNEMRKHLH